MHVIIFWILVSVVTWITAEVEMHEVVLVEFVNLLLPLQ